MANLFSGLESLGLGNLSEMKLFEHKEKEKAAAIPQLAATPCDRGTKLFCWGRGDHI